MSADWSAFSRKPPSTNASALIVTRTIASLTAIFHAAARYWVLAVTVHHPDLAGPQDVIAILRNLTLVGGLLILAAAGAGPLSLDAIRSGRML